MTRPEMIATIVLAMLVAAAIFTFVLSSVNRQRVEFTH